MNTLSLALDPAGVALVTLHRPCLPAYVPSDAFMADMQQVVERIRQDPAIVGAVITWDDGHGTPDCDIEALGQFIEATNTQGRPPVAAFLAQNQLMRSLETTGKPVAAAMHGAVSGGALELCLACHYRVIADAEGSAVSLPAIQTGLLPASGGTQRLPRLIGIEAALPILLDGHAVSQARARELGIVDAIVPRADLLAHAHAWVRAHPDASQPWDRKGWRIPGDAGALAEHAPRSFYAGMAQVRGRTHDNYPAPLALLSAVYEGTQLPLERGTAVEARYAAQLAVDPVTRNLVRTLFVNRARCERPASRPAAPPSSKVMKLGVLGAGMMGVGIACSAAQAGLTVVLLDASSEQARAGKTRAVESARRMGGEVGREVGGEAAAAQCDARITATARYDDLRECDFVIEAVFETRAVKSEVLGRVCEVLHGDAILASNTSTLPISGLATLSDRPTRFIGMHFFSPVERMPLLEIIVGEQTSQETLARAMDLARTLRKTPIVVNDSPGFFTSRIFCSYVDEAMAMLAEGVAPALVENAARMAGMAASPLAVLDEVSLDLQLRVVNQAIEDGLDERFLRSHARPVIARMNALGRTGRKCAAGFYVYPEGGRKHLWSGLVGEYPLKADQPDVEVVKQRLLYIQALESVRCLDEGVITSAADADIGAILGLGFPSWTGGPLSLIETVGVARFIATCETLAAAHGARFSPPPSLRSRVA